MRKETTVRILPVRPGTIASGAPNLVCDAVCGWAFAVYSLPNNSRDKNVNVNKEKNKMFIKWLANNFIDIFTNLFIMKDLVY